MDEPDSAVGGKLAFMLDHAAWVVRGNLERTLKDRGLNWGRYCLLRALHDVGECRITRLSELCHQEQPTTSKWLQELDQSGLTKRAGGVRDLREIMVSLTLEGERTLNELIADAAAFEQRAAARFPALASEQFLAALRPVAEAGYERPRAALGGGGAP